MAESGGSRSPGGGTEDDKDKIAETAGDVKRITQSTQSGSQEVGGKATQKPPGGGESGKRRKPPKPQGEDGASTGAFQKEEEKKFAQDPSNKNASPKRTIGKYVSHKRSTFEKKESSNNTDLKNYESQKTFSGKEIHIASEKGLVREKGETDDAPDSFKTDGDAFGNQSDKMDGSFVMLTKQDVPSTDLTNQNPGEKNREETTKNTEAALKEEESAQKHSEGQNKCKSNFDTASPKPSERNDSHDIVMKKNILDEPTGGQLSPAGSDGGTNQEDATVSDEEGTQYFMNNLREDGSNIEGEEEGADNLKGVLTLSERKETDAETKEIIRGTDTTDVATSEAVEDAGSWKGIATSGGQNKTETKTEEISKETDATDDASSEAEHEDSLEQTDKSEEQKETETLAEHNNDRETDISDVDDAPPKTAEHVGRFEGTVTSSRQRVTQETQAGESHKSLEINEHSLSETGQVDHVEDSETSSVLKEKEMQPDPSCSETVNKNHVHSEGSSSSIEQLAHGPDSDKEGTEIESGEHALLHFQMSSMTQLPENAESSMKCDKTLAFQEQHSELHSNDTRDTDKPGNSSDEAEESNTCEPWDLKKTKLGGSDKRSMSVKNYSLKKVGRDYLLFSENHKPVKMDILKGETNVTLEEDNLILINDEVKYYFTDEEGDITVHEIGEARSDKKSNSSGRKEPKEKHQDSLFQTTSYEKKEEKLSTEVGKKTGSSLKVRATNPQSDELLTGPNNQSSQGSDSHEAGAMDTVTDMVSKMSINDSETNSEGPSESTQTQTDIFPGRSGSKDTTKIPKPTPRKQTHDGREPCQGQSSQPVPPPRRSRGNDKHQSLQGNELKSEGQGKQSDIPVRLFHGEKEQYFHVKLGSHTDHVKLLYLLQNEEASKLLNEKMRNRGICVRKYQIEISVKEELGNEGDGIIQNFLALVVDNISNLHCEEMKLENDGHEIMRDIMHTDLAKNCLLYAHFFQEQKVLVFVCQDDVKEQANQECLKVLKHRNLDSEHIYERTFPIHMGFNVVCDTYNIKQQISEKFPGVSFSYEIDDKDKTCQCCVRGPDEKVLEETAIFLEEFLNEHPFSSVSFSDIIKDRKIDSETLKNVLSNELKCFIETKKAVVNCDIDIKMERVTIVGQSQNEVDMVQTKLRKLLKEFEIDLPLEVCRDLLSEIKLEGTNRVSMVSFGNKCCCIGRSEVIKMLEEKYQKFIKEKGKKDEEESKLSLKPYLVTENSGDKPENKICKTVVVKDLNIFKLLENKLCKEKGNVEIIPTECNGKHGFKIKAYDGGSILAAEQNIRQLASEITDKLLSLEFQESKVNELLSLKSSVEDSCSVVIKVNSKDYVSPDGTTVRVSLGNAEDHWENLLVEVIQGEGKPTLVKHDGKMLTQLYVPVCNMEPGKADGTHALQDSAQRVLELVKSNEITHVCLSIYQRHGWPLKKFTKQILKALKSYMKKSHSVPVVFELCLEDIGEFRQCQQIMKETLQEYDPDSDTCEEEHDMCQETNQSRSVQVCVGSGKLHEIGADVLVNTTSDTLDLSSGAVSKSLLNTAGQELQKECRCRYRSGIKEGQIAVTKGYKLNCKNVFHGSVPGYKMENERECLQKLDNFITACLDKALKMGHTSIAFPAIGTGNLQYPTEKVAVTMFNSVKQFADKQYAARSEKELAVCFVIFPPENKHVFLNMQKDLFENIQKSSRVVPPTSRSACITVSNVRVNARIVSAKSCRGNEALIYFWDSKKLHGVRKEEKFLKEADITQDFFEKRHTYTGPFVTGAGAFGSGKILHIPLQDAGDCLLQGFRDGILLADKEGCSAAAFLFTLQSPFLKYQEKLSEALIAAVKDVAEKLKHLNHITLDFEEPLNAKKLLQPFGRDNKSKEKAVTTDERYTCVELSVKGLPYDIDQAKQRLEKWSKESETQHLLKATTSFDLHRQVDVPKEPEPQTIEGRECGPPGLTGMPAAGKVNLVKRESLGTYILVSNIPGGYSFASLSERLLKPGLPVGFKRLIYLEGSKDALIICSTSEDACKLSGCCEVKPFTFQCIEKQSLGPFDCCIRKSEVEKMQRDGNVSKFKEALKELNVDVSGSEELKVVAETSCQMSWALRLKQEYCSDEKRNMTSSDGYVHIEKISDVKEEIWKIMQVKKEKEMQQFEEELGNLNFCGNGIIATLKEENNKATFMKLMDEFKSFVEDFRKLEFQTVEIEAQYVNNIESWMKEIEEIKGKSCCTYLPGDKKVIAYFDSYEEVKKVEHHFLIKQKIIKPTGRRRKVTHDKQLTSGPTSLQGYYSAELGETDSCSMNRIADFEWEKDAKHVELYKTNEGIQVYVYVADILKLPVDCIVNAANNSLSHGGGVAKAIANGAGPALNREGESYIESFGKIKVGHAMSTGAGRLPYKRVIHTVGPSWHFYRPHDVENISRCENDLINAVYNSFLEAEKYHLKKIALPAISAAIFAVPKDLCVCMYVKATLKYSCDRTPSPLSEIHFVDKDPRIIAMIQEEFNCVLKKGEDSPYIKKSKRQGRWSESQKSGHEDLLSENKSLIISPEYALLDGMKNVFYFCGNKEKKLLIYKGDLLSVRNAAVVATIGDKYSKGRIAQTIASRIPYHQKDAYRNELEKKLHPSCSPGTLIMTEGYGSGFDKIFHVVFPPNARLKETTYRRKDLHKAFCNIFTKALSEKDIGTISTTLIGIDDSKPEELDMCCDVFLEEYVSIAKDKLLQRVKPFDVHLVLQTENNARRVTAKFKEFVDRQQQHFQAMSSMANEGQDTHYQKPKASSSNETEMDNCVICLDTMTNAETLKCGHRYCKECIEQHFQVKKTCPSCGAVCGVITGDQPQGDMKYYFSPHHHCTGYERCGQIIITYTFSSGRQEQTHPNPGVWYDGITRTAYLPDNEEGRKILKMLIVAFHRKLVFTIGRSRTTGKEGVITWNDIHHKTDWRSYSQFGYPDETYLQRVTEELAAKGVTEKDIVDITL